MPRLRMGMRESLLAVFLAGVLQLTGPADAGAQVRIGPQLSFGSEQDVGLGGRVTAQFRSPMELGFIGSFDVFFPDEPRGEDRSYWEINTNLAYWFRVRSTSVHPYAGGGLNIAHASRDGTSDTDLGLNLLGGSAFGAKRVRPFAELRVELAGGDQFVVTGGVLF